MVTTATNISIVLSGGSTNASPANSIGGTPSNTPITSHVINNLFQDISADEQEGGFEDYRCFYIFNDGDTPIYTIRLWITEEVINGASIEMGIKTSSEIQRITISPIPTTGSVTLSFEGIQFILNANSNVAVLANELKNKLNSLINDEGYSALKQVNVTGQSLTNQIVFDIDFSGGLGGLGRDDKKDHGIIAVVSDTFNNDAEITVATIQEGSPVNSIAELIETPLAQPAGVEFFQPTEVSPITIAYLFPSEGFPIWVKRVATEDAIPIENDGFTFRLKANSLDPYR
jgi:hypothetical protein